MSEQDLEFQVKVTQSGDGLEQTQRQLQGLGRTATATGEAAHKAGGQMKETGKEIKELGKIGHEAERVLEGLERGGIGGMITALRNFGAMLKAAGAAIGGPFLAALVAVGVAWKVVTDIITRNEHAIEKIFEERKKQIEERKKLVEEMGKETAKAFKEAAEAAKIETAAMQALDHAMDEAAKRSGTLIKAQNELTLAMIRSKGGDTTAMEAKMGMASEESKGLNAGLAKDKATEDILAISGQRSAAQGVLRDAQHLAENSYRDAQRFGPDNHSEEAAHARSVAIAAATNYKTAQKTFAEADRGFTAADESALNRKMNADTTQRASGMNRQTMSLNATTKINPQRTELEAKARSQYAAGDYSGQSHTVKALEELNKQAKALDTTAARVVTATTQTMAAVNVKFDSMRNKMVRSSQAGPGGG